MTPRQQRFVEQYLVDLNAKRAALDAGYSPKTAEQQGYQLLQKPSVQAAIAAAQADRSKRTGITAEAVLQELWSIATADPNALIEWRRGCCRYCHGDGHRYQRTPRELLEYEAAFTKAAEKNPDAPQIFDPQGGAGYDARRKPDPDCPECFGDGEGQTFVKDTRALSADARRLYAGVKLTKDGLEVKMHDKVAALTKVGQHLGMFVERHEHTGANGGAILTDVVDRPPRETREEWEARRAREMAA